MPEVQMIYAPTAPCPPGEYRYYRSVPWHRRSGVNIFLILLGLLCPPLLWWAVGNSLTGRVYMPAKNRAGYLRTWCPVSKFATVIVLVFQTAVLALAIPALATGRITPQGPTNQAVAETADEAKADTDAPSAVSRTSDDNASNAAGIGE
ncbi:MAG: hypothetical protein GVY16_03515 [Planctomycetes bacterium]|nr:hypothetical protein [Planctomycetota bacterium]